MKNLILLPLILPLSACASEQALMRVQAGLDQAGVALAAAQAGLDAVKTVADTTAAVVDELEEGQGGLTGFGQGGDLGATAAASALGVNLWRNNRRRKRGDSV